MTSVLALNAGSSGTKFALFNSSPDPGALFRGTLETTNSEIRIVVKGASGEALNDEIAALNGPNPTQLIEWLLNWVEHRYPGTTISAVGHRVVHGGGEFQQPVVVSESVLTALEALTPLAPLHQPHCLAPIRALRELRPRLAQVACFDTAFHSTMPEIAQRLALPAEATADGVRRYGFHGLSYEYIAHQLTTAAPALANGRVVVAHLGSGASLCALERGRSIDTTMGLTALDGLVMGTRCGTIDPGALLYLMQHKGMSAADLVDLLYRRSGLLGASGISADIRELRKYATPPALKAIELFVYRAAQQIAAMVVALGGIDGMVFTGGIGEHDAATRAAIAAHLAWLGVSIDCGVNEAGHNIISTPGSRVEVHVIPTDEEIMLARHTYATLRAQDP